MVRQCSIISCKAEGAVNWNGITCHTFPTKDAALRKKWVDAIPGDLLKGITKNTFICSLHFRPENYSNTPLGRNHLKKDAVPALFETLQRSELKQTNEFLITSNDVNVSQKRPADENVKDDVWNVCGKDKKNTLRPDVACNTTEVCTQTSPKRLKPNPREETLKKKVDNLQKRLRRRDSKIRILEEVIKTLKDTSTYSEGIQNMLKKHFSGDKLELLLNEANNNDVTPSHRQYSEDIKQFALAMYFYSPKAYELLRKYLCLPHPATLRKWMVNCDCEPGSEEESSEACPETE